MMNIRKIGSKIGNLSIAEVLYNLYFCTRNYRRCAFVRSVG